MIFPDFTREVQRNRASFTTVKAKLPQLHLPYTMIFPARLRVADPTGACFFNSLQAAWDWLGQVLASSIHHKQRGTGSKPAARQTIVSHLKEPRSGAPATIKSDPKPLRPGNLALNAAGHCRRLCPTIKEVLGLLQLAPDSALTDHKPHRTAAIMRG